MHLPPAPSRVAFLQKGAWWGADEGAILAWEEGTVGRKKCLRNVEATLQWLRSPIVPLAVAVTS